MITILFISDDSRVADLIARIRPRLKARMRLALDFDQGLKEVFDNRPSAVFIQGDISGISGETVARHIKTLLRTDAPRVVLIHSSPLAVQGTKKWFDDTVDFSLPQTELVEQFRLRLKEIAPDHWLEQDDVQTGSVESIPAASVTDASPSQLPSFGEFEPFDWEAPGNAAIAAVPPPSVASTPDGAGDQGGAPTAEIPQAPEGTVAEAPAPNAPSPAPELREVMPSLSEESAPVQPAVQGRLSPPPADTASQALPPRDAKPAPLPQSSPPPRGETPDDRFAAFLDDFGAERPVGGHAEWVAIPPPGQEFERATGPRLTLWSAAVVVLLIGAVVGGALLLKGEGKKKATAARPAATVPPPVRPSSGPAPAAKIAPAVKTAPVAGLPSFVPASGKDKGYGKAHPGWERYRGGGIEYRLFREQGRLKAVQVIALRGKPIPETLAAAVVKELMGSESRTVSSRTKKGGYRLESGRVDRKGEVVIYRKGGGIRGIVVTLD